MDLAWRTNEQKANQSTETITSDCASQRTRTHAISIAWFHEPPSGLVPHPPHHVCHLILNQFRFFYFFQHFLFYSKQNPSIRFNLIIDSSQCTKESLRLGQRSIHKSGNVILSFRFSDKCVIRVTVRHQLNAKIHRIRWCVCDAIN